ncbi:MAG: type VI secretion system tube protein Hcp [Bryobacteraceae bacterium]|nr:type VI secretion system tube protein Hcp [Solibacteraceae bacterium]MCL4844269.1 type VI secretion system tube protein Hcp [Bryobacteraceae bacterium]MCO5352443.1 type VI secretion system tube protein Hcp [Bryobacteraceae bacterium]
MPVNAFLKYGDIEGETLNEQHPKHIEIHNYSWSGSHTGSPESGGGLAAGKAQVDDLMVTKTMDKSSPKLKLACCTGKPVDQAYLVVDRAGDTPTTYLKITLDKAVISSYNVNGGGGDLPMESLSLSYTKVSIDYIPVDDDGNPQGAINANYNLKLGESD